jgi:hypothetical protein
LASSIIKLASKSVYFYLSEHHNTLLFSWIDALQFHNS